MSLSQLGLVGAVSCRQSGHDGHLQSVQLQLREGSTSFHTVTQWTSPFSGTVGSIQSIKLIEDVGIVYIVYMV